MDEFWIEFIYVFNCSHDGEAHILGPAIAPIFPKEGYIREHPNVVVVNYCRFEIESKHKI